MPFFSKDKKSSEALAAGMSASSFELDESMLQGEKLAGDNNPVNDRLNSEFADPRRNSVGVGSQLDGPFSRRQSAIADHRKSLALFREDDMSFTWRAVILGSLVGCIICVSNIYLGLRSGITFGATLFATLLGTLILTPVVKLMGGELGLREHVCFQAAGTASGGIHGGLVAPILVLFWNGYFTGSVSSNIGQLILLVFGAAGFGIVFAVFLRKFLIVRQKLVFPDGTAAAEILTTMYASKEGAEEGRRKAKVMVLFFAAAFVFAIWANFFPGLVEFSIFRYLSNCGTLIGGGSMTAAWQECAPDPNVFSYFLVMDAWSYKMFFDPVFVASAFMVGPSVNIWMMIGSIVFGIVCAIDFSKGSLGTVPRYGTARDKVTMWAAVLGMLVASVMYILLDYEMIRDVLRDTLKLGKKNIVDDNESTDEASNKENGLDETTIRAQAERERDTPFIVWGSLLLVTIGMTLTIYLALFGDAVNWWECLLGIGTTLPIAIVATQVVGRANWSIAATLAKFTMMIMAALGSGSNAMLFIGNMVTQAASQTGEVSQCYKTAYLTNSSPAAQFNAQVIGTSIGGVMSVIAFWIFTLAYPCILDPQAETCAFSMPAGHAWNTIATALSGGVTVGDNTELNAAGLAVNPNTMTNIGFWLLIIMPLLTAAEMAFTRFFLPKRFAPYMPNWNVFYLGFFLPPSYIFAQFLGQCIMWVWKAIAPQQCTDYTYSVSAGIIAGGSVASLVVCAFQVLELPVVSWGIFPH